jgi:hypothetical protein
MITSNNKKQAFVQSTMLSFLLFELHHLSLSYTLIIIQFLIGVYQFLIANCSISFLQYLLDPRVSESIGTKSFICYCSSQQSAVFHFSLEPEIDLLSSMNLVFVSLDRSEVKKELFEGGTNLRRGKETLIPADWLAANNQKVDQER